MKITSNKTLSYLKRRQVCQARSLLRSAGRCKHLRQLASLNVLKKHRSIQIKAPGCFGLVAEESREDLLRFIKELGGNLTEGRHVVIDFSDTSDLHACGTLYFLAYLDTLLYEFPNKIKCKLPKNEIVEQLFQHVGLLAKFGRSPRLKVTAENVVSWHYATGTDATTDAFKSLLLQHGEAMGGLITRSSLYDCMSEAVTNTRKHAYPGSHKSHANHWWMFSQANGGKLEVVICDLGIGIPKSLLTKPEMRDYFRKLLMVGRQMSHDKELIKIVTSTNRTSTGLEYRGKGLPQMLDFIKNGSSGGFRAQSGHGCYTFNAARQKDKATTFRRPIKGTLIQWTLQLNC